MARRRPRPDRPSPGLAAHELAESVALGRLAAAAGRTGAGCEPADRTGTDPVHALTLRAERHEVVVTFPAALAERGLPVCYEADVWSTAGPAGPAAGECFLGTLYCGLALDASPSALDGLVRLLLDLPALTEAILAQTPDPDVALRLLVAGEPPTV